jgi:tetratricopeptide (TPR) repeat protein
VSPATARFAACLTAAWLALLGARAAHADESEARLRAQDLLNEGNLLFRNGDARGALDRYRAAYDAFPSPKLFLNIGLCEEGLGEHAQAMNSYTRFLAEAQETLPAVRAEAEQHMHALEPLLTSIELTGSASGVVTLDDAPAGIMPVKTPLWTKPGMHRLSVEQPGKPAWVTTLVGEPGGRLAFEVPEPTVTVAPKLTLSEATVEKTPPPIESRSPPPRSHRWWLWTALGAVVVGGALTTFLILRNRCPATNGCE